MSKFNQALQALHNKVIAQLGYNIPLSDMLTCTTKNELISFITGYLIGSNTYEPTDDVLGYVNNLTKEYPDLGKFQSF